MEALVELNRWRAGDPGTQVRRKASHTLPSPLQSGWYRPLSWSATPPRTCTRFSREQGLARHKQHTFRQVWVLAVLPRNENAAFGHSIYWEVHVGQLQRHVSRRGRQRCSLNTNLVLKLFNHQEKAFRPCADTLGIVESIFDVHCCAFSITNLDRVDGRQMAGLQIVHQRPWASMDITHYAPKMP